MVVFDKFTGVNKGEPLCKKRLASTISMAMSSINYVISDNRARGDLAWWWWLHYISYDDFLGKVTTFYLYHRIALVTAAQWDMIAHQLLTLALRKLALVLSDNLNSKMFPWNRHIKINIIITKPSCSSSI